MRIGFIGLGNMGLSMAAHLARAGHEVRGYDPAGFSAEGVRNANSYGEVLRGVGIALTMLPDGEVLWQVAGEIIPALPRGAVFVDSSTVDTASARHVAGRAEEAGLFALEAPGSGGAEKKAPPKRGS